MAQRRFNWILAIVIVIVLVVLAVTAVGLRKWQRNRMSLDALETGLQAYEDRQWEKAASDLGRYIGYNQTDIDILKKYAESQLNIRPLQGNNIQQAIGTYRTILRTDKSNLAAVEKLMSLYLQMGYPAEAELVGQRYLEITQDAVVQRLLAMSYARQRKFIRASDLLQSIIEEHPEDITSYEVIGLLADKYPEDFPKTAKFWFDESVKNNPSSAKAYISRASFRLKQKDTAGALQDIGSAEKQELSDERTRLLLAGVYIQSNVFDKAQEHLEILYGSDPTNQALWQTWAVLALQSKSKDQMLTVAENGLETLGPQAWDFLPLAAELFIRGGQYDRAKECITKLQQKEVSLTKVAFLNGLLALIEGQNYQAIQSWREAIRLGDDSEQTYLILAKVLSQVGDRQSAIRLLRTLVSNQPNTFQGHFELAKLLGQTGRWDEVAEHANLAMQIKPNHLDTVLLYIQTRMQLARGSRHGTDAQIWIDIDKKLAELDNLTNGAFKVKLLQAELAMQQSRYDLANRLLTGLKNSYPDRIEVSMALIDVLIAQNDTDKAILELNALRETFPLHVMPIKYLAALHDRRGNKDECENVLSDAIKQAQSPHVKRDLGLLLADFYEQNQQLDRSYQLLTELSEDMADDISIKRRLLKFPSVADDKAMAQGLVDQIKNIEGDSGWRWKYEQTRLWFSAKDFKDKYSNVVTLLKENLSANPGDQNSRMLLGAVYEKAGELRLAASTYREALNYSPDDVRIIAPAVALLYKLNEYEQADEILSKAARQELTSPELHKLELKSFLRRGKLSSAETLLEELRKSEPGNNNIVLSLALLKTKVGKYDQARKLLSELQEQEHDLMTVTAALVELNIRQKKEQEAIALCDQIVNQLNDASSHIFRGKTYMVLGQNDLAARDFERATEIEPDNAQAWLAKSDFYQLIGNSEIAVSDMLKAMSIDPENMQVKKRAIARFLSSGKTQDVTRGKLLLAEALSVSPEDMELQLYQARDLMLKQDAPSVKLSIKILQGITGRQPKATSAWAMLAQIYIRQNQTGKAMDTILRGLTYSPMDKNLLMLKAQAEANRSPALAVPTLKELKELYPGDVDVTINLAAVYVAVEQYERAIKLLTDQLTGADDSDTRKLNIALAKAFYKNGNKEQAAQKFEILYQSAPDDVSIFIAEVELLAQDEQWSELMPKISERFAKQYDDTAIFIELANSLVTAGKTGSRKTAEDVLQMILKKDPDSVAAMTGLAILQQTAGRFDVSAKLYQKVIEADPEAEVALNNLAWILCEELGKHDQAFKVAQQGLKKNPQYTDLIDTRGVIYYRLGQHEKAIEDFTRCIELYQQNNPATVSSYFHLARAQAAMGQKDRAVQNLRKAMQLNSELGGLAPPDLSESERILRELTQE